MTKKEFNEIVRLVWKEEKYERENMKLMMTIPLNYVMNSTSPNGNGLYDMSHVVDGDHEDDDRIGGAGDLAWSVVGQGAATGRRDLV